MSITRKPIQKQKALELRKEGKSIKDIAKFLNVSSSTVSLWVRHIELTPQQKQFLERKVFETLQQGRIKAQKIQAATRKILRNTLELEASKEFGHLSKRDIFVAGITLYWTEGFKKDNRLGFANSDPTMVRLFLKWLYALGVPRSAIRLRVGLNISHKQRVGIVEKFWSEQTQIPLDQFQKPFYQKFIWKKEFTSPEKYFGVIRVRAIDQGRLFIKIKKWITLIQGAYLPK